MIDNVIAGIEIYNLLCYAEKVYGPYKRKSDGRSIVIIKNDDGSKRTVSYPKHIMERHIGRQLDPDSTVDHINFDFNDNRIENLRIVPRDIHSADDTRRVEMVKLKCSMCKKPFERSPRIIRDKAKKKVSGSFCSRRCSGQFARALQLGKIKKKFPSPKPVKSNYYRRKNIAELSDYLLKKYAGFVNG